MENISYPAFAAISASLWVVGGSLLTIKKRRIQLVGNISLILGLAVFSVFIALKWIYLERPLLKTIGETRLWFALFTVALAYLVYLRSRHLAVLWSGTGIALFFVWINVRIPENFDQELMPILQSPWFVPHVVVYILSYTFLGLSSVVALLGILIRQKENYTQLSSNMVYAGFSLLTLGLVFGAFWAKEAWGHYWNWDPKEIWAFLTWLIYLGFIHFKHYHPNHKIAQFCILSLAFGLLLICWLGLGYSPQAQNSVHLYLN